jgi:hypothetical protein
LRFLNLNEYPPIPILHRADPGNLEGVLSLEDALRAYRRVSEARKE